MLELVDPFLGSEVRNLPEPEGIAAAWFLIKAQIGNTHPGASLPHDPVSALPYSGGYPTGYGRYAPNFSGPPDLAHQTKCLYGVTHVQPSGTGSIGFYYNFLLTRPFLGEAAVPPIDLSYGQPAAVHEESAEPGWYRCRIPEWDTTLELVAARNAVLHRYTPSGAVSGPRGILVHVTNGGLGRTRGFSRPDSVTVTRTPEGASGSFVHYGIRWFFSVLLRDRGASGAGRLWRARAGGDDASKGLTAWIPVEPVDNLDELEMDATSLTVDRAGILWPWDGEEPFEISVGLSQDSVQAAQQNAARVLALGFEEQRRDTAARWHEHFAQVTVSGGSDREQRLFWSCWFHASRKPMQGEGSNFLWKNGPELWTDVATMWDQYKTLIPFLATFYPEKALSLARSLYRTGTTLGRFPNAVVNASNQSTFERQSRNLAVTILCEVYQHLRLRAIADQAEWVRMLPFLVGEVEREFHELAERDMVHSHRLDISYAASCLSRTAELLGETQYRRTLEPIMTGWKEAIDPETGFMRNGAYYEGDAVHYSFRLLHSMRERIKLAGGDARFAEMLDHFFGYGCEPVQQIGPGMSQEEGLALGRFDGLNNEVMMETPFAYHFLGLPDRTNEIVHAVQRFCFDHSPGGLPGNDDSGGLSSWYVWNALGLFPLSGSGRFFVSLPLLDQAEIRNCGFRVRRISSSPNGGAPVYFRKLRLNGEELSRTFLSLAEVLSGGELEIHLTDQPKSYTVEELPPSSNL